MYCSNVFVEDRMWYHLLSPGFFYFEITRAVYSKIHPYSYSYFINKYTHIYIYSAQPSNIKMYLTLPIWKVFLIKIKIKLVDITEIQ